MAITNTAIEKCLLEGAPTPFGIVTGADGISLKISGLRDKGRLGDDVLAKTRGGETLRAQIVAIEREFAIAAAYESLNGIAAGDRAMICSGRHEVYPCDAWLGRVINPFAEPLDGEQLSSGDTPYRLYDCAPPASQRKLLGARQRTGLCALDTFLPICKGQRMGVFSGPGVGKSTLLGDLIRGMSCDVAVVGLIGERGREVRAFLENTLGPQALKRSVVVVSTADQSPLAKKRAGYLAQATAEYFRDQNKQVLLVVDSLTRFAEAHREIGLSIGETPSLHAYPPSTFRTVASLVERAGPGKEGVGDISAIYSVLVAGSDMNEPVADMVQGILDGGIILNRKIAERGRFPAIDVARSLSRSLPAAASQHENELLRQARAVIGVYEDSEAMVRAGLYAPGSDERVDQALATWPALDAFIGEMEPGGAEESFRRLQAILATGQKPPDAPAE